MALGTIHSSRLSWEVVSVAFLRLGLAARQQLVTRGPNCCGNYVRTKVHPDTSYAHTQAACTRFLDSTCVHRTRTPSQGTRRDGGAKLPKSVCGLFFDCFLPQLPPLCCVLQSGCRHLLSLQSHKHLREMCRAMVTSRPVVVPLSEVREPPVILTGSVHGLVAPFSILFSALLHPQGYPPPPPRPPPGVPCPPSAVPERLSHVYSCAVSGFDGLVSSISDPWVPFLLPTHPALWDV